MKGMMNAKLMEMREKFADGLAAYRLCDWQKATHAFNNCLELNPDDGPSLTFIKRTEILQINPPEPGWNGTWVITQK
jgi:hypothetical protein